ncbi:FKBP-type peptidyl-prolyl cis-trans isomerase [Cryobacterium psychrophilum]|uniref:peptidylprolyl isomerase n=1 Tax=Cryobacterium psychrophilum TaxID=41988 RepID=A0A4Y8KTE0_9MICO|nr:FKBP-type peptidyl-prolyl cis-trans isomerase [Cryobacterium psychrophilum]TDW31123.1 peptidylprolyl isomerase [Cryobacterium psychrophilum]TFD78580.1 peptidylprolyl isomerase [Cryobacterium psychrophilum]
MSKKLALLVTTLGLTAALTACSGSSSAPNSTDAANADRTVSPTSECTDAGSVSDAIDVTGDFGAEPTVTMDSPVKTTATERTVAIEGTGTEKTKAGSVVNVSFSAFNGATSEKVDSTGYGAESSSVSLTVADNYVPGLVRAVNCSVAGDRVVAVMPPSDGFGDKGWSDLGLGTTDSMIFVIDINSIQPAKANGVDQPVQAGLPTVTLADNGEPTISIPKTDAPSDLTIATLKKGDGAVVAAGDTAQIEYTGVLWATGKEFDSSWKTDGPAAMPTANVVKGFADALVGQTVGSQVLAVIPPVDGYGTDGNSQAGISGTDTLVFVVDILGTGPTPAAPAQ